MRRESFIAMWLVGAWQLFAKVLYVVLAELISLVAGAVLLIMGMRRLNFAPLRHPLQYAPSYIWRRRQPSIWWTRKTTNAYGQTIFVSRASVWGVVNPPMFIMLSLMGWLMYLDTGATIILVLGLSGSFLLGALVLMFETIFPWKT